jgi:hypothetical protein
VALPSLSATSRCLVVTVALVETSGLLAGGGETAGLAVLERALVETPRCRGRLHTL